MFDGGSEIWEPSPKYLETPKHQNLAQCLENFATWSLISPVGMYFVIYGNLHISCKFTVNLQYLFYVNLHDSLHLCILTITCRNIIESRAILLIPLEMVHVVLLQSTQINLPYLDHLTVAKGFEWCVKVQFLEFGGHGPLSPLHTPLNW